MKGPCEPLVLPAIAFASGIVFENCLGLDPPVLLAAISAVLLLWIIFRRHWPCGVAVALFAGALAVPFHAHPPDPVLAAEPGETLLLAGCVSSPVAVDGVQSRFVLDLEPGARARVTLTAREGETLPSVRAGENVEIEAKVRKPRNFGNPGAFDYVGFLRRDRIFWLASARGVEKFRRQPGTCGSPLQRTALTLREALSSRIAALYRDDRYAARLMPALLVGDNSQLGRSWTADFRRTGTYHAIVISGLHITLVAGGALALLRMLSVPHALRLLCAATLAWTYAAVANWQAPVLRSALGFTLFLVAQAIYRDGRVLNLLAVTAIALLAFDPDALYDPSFQLTFLSVAAIAAVADPLLARTWGPFAAASRSLRATRNDLHFEPEAAEFRVEMRLVADTFGFRHATEALELCLRFGFAALGGALLSACVQLALLVPTVTYFHQVSATGILANLTAVPALSAAVPVGLLAAVTNSSVLAALAGWLLAFARVSTEWWASVEPALRVPDPPLALSLALLASLTAFALSLVLRWRTPLVLIFVACSLVLAAVFVVEPFRPDVVPRSMELTAIDTGQGDSLLIVLPDQSTILVDGGGFPVFDRRLRSTLDIGEDVVSPYLWRRKLHRLDVVAVSHLHDDHAAGLPAVIRNFRPREIWTGAVPADSALMREIRKAASVAGSSIRQRYAGESTERGGATVAVLSPGREYVPGDSARNNDSLVLLLRYGRHRFLLTGDAEHQVETELVERGVMSDIDVLKIGHHGSRSSTTPRFIDATHPLFAMISVGEGNFYGHPHPRVLSDLLAMGTAVLRTDRQGLLQIRSDGHALTVNRYSDTLADYRQTPLGVPE